MPALEKSKVTRKKKSHSNENVIYKPTEKHKPEPEPTLTISAYEIEQLRKSEAKMLHRLNHLRKRVKHFEKRFQSMPKPGITHNKSCEAIGLYDTAVQTCAQKSGKFKEYCEETENLKSVIEKLNLKIVELTEISKVNQLVNVDSNSASTLQNVEFSRCLNHLEKRMDRLSELVQNKRTPCMRLMSNFALTEFGNGDQLQTNPVEQLFLRSTEKFGQKYKKLQSIVIVNEPIYPEVSIYKIFKTHV